MARNNCYRDGHIHVCAVMCKTCIFHSDGRSGVSSERIEKMVMEACKRETAVVCHSTIGTATQAVCRGFYEKHKTLPLVMANAMGLIRLQRPD